MNTGCRPTTIGSSMPASVATCGAQRPAASTTIGASIRSPALVSTPVTRWPCRRTATTSTPCSITAPRRRAASANPAVTAAGSPYPERGSQRMAPRPDGSMRGSMRASAPGSTISASIPMSRCRTRVRSRVDRIAGATPMSAPHLTNPESPPTAAPKSSKTASERRTISLVSRVGYRLGMIPTEYPVPPDASALRSRTSTRRTPRPARWKAIETPITPPPMMITSAVLIAARRACGPCPGPAA